MCQAFWDDYKAETLLKGDVLKRVSAEQFVDMKNRYGQLRPLPATMLVAKNSDGVIVGIHTRAQMHIHM